MWVERDPRQPTHDEAETVLANRGAPDEASPLAEGAAMDGAGVDADPFDAAALPAASRTAETLAGFAAFVGAAQTPPLPALAALAAAPSPAAKPRLTLDKPFAPRRSSLMPTSHDLSEAQMIAKMERMNAALASNPHAVTSTTHLAPSLASASASVSHDIDKPFWLSVLECAADDPAYPAKHAALIKARARAGVPEELRPRIWIALAAADTAAMKPRYELLLATVSNSGIDKIIKRDIPRTFPNEPMFKEDGGPGQTMLFNILRAYSIYDSDCGYCQGLSFIVAPLLMQGIPEVDAFAVFVRLMEESSSTSSAPSTSSSSGFARRAFALRTLFTPDMPGLHLLLHQHAELIRILLPSLHAKFQELGVTATTYASPWFLTLFTYSFPLPLVHRIVDLILSEGAVPVMLKVSVAVLKRNEALLCTLDDFESVLEILKGFGTLLGPFKGEVEWVVRDLEPLDPLIDDVMLSEISKR
ncbi:rab-GTPase-TBC domain-containing protein [Chytriomyces sp. MP71]|nr:rab-GTPase-TBC domain-containing protein [Chytriomyces sp. MP71]